jgi:vacuolar protein sorting-associated protein 13A/C
VLRLLTLSTSKYPDSGGAFKAQIFSPYAIINKTGLDFTLKAKPWMSTAKSVAGQTDASSRRAPDPFLFSYPSVDRRNRALLRIGDSAWSRVRYPALAEFSREVLTADCTL